VKIILIGVLAFTAVAVMEALFYTLRFLSDRRDDELKRRLSSLGSSDSPGARSGIPGLLRRDKLSSNPTIDAMLRSLKLSARLESLLEQTELEISVGTLLGICLGGFLGGILLGIIADSGLVMSLVLAVLFGMIPIFYVMFMRSRRSQRLSEQLPDALEMMARSLRAGHALSSAFKMVATEMPTPVCIEFGRAFEAQELGLPFEKAISDMTRRAPDNQDLKIFALSVIVQKETGGNLVEIIEKIAETVRSRYKFQGKLRGLTAEGRMSSYVVGALPICSLLFMLTANRPYVMRLFTSDIGHYCLGYAAFSWTLGFFIMRKMTQIKI
jgi:tight adherence protein B